MKPELVYVLPSYVEPPAGLGADGSLGGGGVAWPAAKNVTVCGSALGYVQVTVSPASTVIVLG